MEASPFALSLAKQSLADCPFVRIVAIRTPVAKTILFATGKIDEMKKQTLARLVKSQLIDLGYGKQNSH